MSNLYPSLEDLNMDHYLKAQEIASIEASQILTGQAVAVPSVGLYSGLGLEELVEYGGLDISHQAIVAHMGESVAQQMESNALVTQPNNLGVKRAEIQPGLRELILCKDQNHKLGLFVKDIDKGMFVAFVWKDSCAARVGLRFGDQIIQVDGESVAGWSGDKLMKHLRALPGQRVSMVVRDRPYERVVTLVKDSQNKLGFLFTKGEITSLIQGKSAANNGLLINHQIIEVNGQNVVALDDSDIKEIVAQSPPAVTLTLMPTFIFQHLIKGIGLKLLRTKLDRSIPEC